MTILCTRVNLTVCRTLSNWSGIRINPVTFNEREGERMRWEGDGSGRGNQLSTIIWDKNQCLKTLL